MTFEELEKEFLKLSGPERREIFSRLIASLDDGRDENVERAWLEEAQRRYRELKGNVVHGIPAKEAIATARERLRNAR